MLRRRILLVDDEPNIHASLKRLLRQEREYEVRSATDGQAALEILDQWHPDILLLDVSMPGLSGIDVCRRARSDPHRRFVKIILVSGLAQTPDRLAGYAAGADDFISKPFDVDELLAKVRVYARLKRAEELDEIKGSLLTLFAHETRTPLTTILGVLELLAVDEALGDESRELARAAQDAGNRLTRLASKILLLSRLKGDAHLKPTAMPLAVALAEVARRAEPAIAAKEIRITLAVPEASELCADWELLHEALDLLVDNAVQHSPSGGEVEVATRAEAGHCWITVSDAGSGVPKAERERIFDEFAVRDLMHHHQGSGLSLAIVRQIAELHGGHVSVTNNARGGAQFSVALPTSSVAAAPAPLVTSPA